MPWNPQSAAQRKHCKRYNTPGHFHFLTFSCHHRQSFLSKDRPRQWLAASLRATLIKHNLRLIAYVFMPEHVHLLIFPKRREYSISAVLQSIKIPVARKARDFLLQTFRFWQAGGGYDRNIFSGTELWEKIHYIHQNPVTRKLLPIPTDWPWSSAADYAHLRTGPLPLDNHNLPWPER